MIKKAPFHVIRDINLFITSRDGSSALQNVISNGFIVLQPIINFMIKFITLYYMIGGFKTFKIVTFLFVLMSIAFKILTCDFHLLKLKNDSNNIIEDRKSTRLNSSH